MVKNIGCFVILMFAFIILFIGNAAKATQKCEECTKISPCYVYVKDSIDCNSCQIETYCENDKWFQVRILGCTLIYCQPPPVEIFNPFEEKK